ncbi:MAG: hypothetical protein O4965_31025 [Trichodesmium sp. St19_bin1]|nr:hypothetical protein [Trichodesmium sp. St19_bin1]
MQIGTFHGTSLQSFGYGDVVDKFEKRCIISLSNIMVQLRRPQ